MYKEIEIKTNLDLPYKLIDISENDEQFIFSFKSFDPKQTEYSIQSGGVTGAFEITYRCKGIESQFECDITVGNVFDFYHDLDYAYDIQCGKDTAATLKNYGDTLNRTNLSFTFDKKGHCVVVGNFRNKNTQYKSGITFELQIDQTYIPEILRSFELFFAELRRIQGHGVFY